MRKVLICLVGAAFVMPIQSAIAEISWYLGAGGSLTDFDSGTSFASTTNPSAPTFPGPSVLVSFSSSNGVFGDKPFGWQVYGGVQFSEIFGFLAKYSDSGKAKDQWPVNATTVIDLDGVLPPPLAEANDQVTVSSNYSFNGEIQMDGFTLYLTQTLPIGEKFEFSLELGWTRQDIDFQWNSSVTNTVTPPGPPPPPPPLPTGTAGAIKTDDSGFAIGGLFRYKFVKHVAVSGEIEWLRVDFGNLIDNPIRFNLNLEYHF